MGKSDHYARSAKRRKLSISGSSSPPTPPSRALRAVKNAVFRSPATNARSPTQRRNDEDDQNGEVVQNFTQNASDEGNGTRHFSITSPTSALRRPVTYGTVGESRTRKAKNTTAGRKPPVPTTNQISAAGYVLNDELPPRNPDKSVQSAVYKPRTKLPPETLAKLAQGTNLVWSEKRKVLAKGASTQRDTKAEANGIEPDPPGGGVTVHDGPGDDGEAPKGKGSKTKLFFESSPQCAPQKGSSPINDRPMASPPKQNTIKRNHISSERKINPLEAPLKSQGKKHFTSPVAMKRGPGRRGSPPDSSSVPPLKRYKGYVYVPIVDDQDEQGQGSEEPEHDIHGQTMSPTRRIGPSRTSRPSARRHQRPQAKRRPVGSPTPVNEQETSPHSLIQEHDTLDEVDHHIEERAKRALDADSAQKNPRSSTSSQAHRISSRDGGGQLEKHKTAREKHEMDVGALKELRNVMARTSEDHVDRLKSSIMSVLTQRSPLAPVGLPAQFEKVSSLLRQTVLAGEGNSLLVLGPRGTGKTALVEHAISAMTSEAKEAFHVIRLSGFMCPDDKTALREIWRQLDQGIEDLGVVEGEGPRGINHADALIRLLALLNHPDMSHKEEKVGQDAGIRSSTKAVIFILDEFHLFASHSRQTLLYNLFDCAQSSTAPIAVLGLSTKLDVAELLEKRVKSRFSQRQVLLTPPRTLSTFKDFCASALSSDRPGTSQTSFNAKLASSLRGKTDITTYNRLCLAWHKYISTHLFDPNCDPLFANYLECLFAHPSAASAFLTSAIFPIARLSADSIPTGLSFHITNLSPKASIKAQAYTTALSPPDSKLSLISCLSTLELTLLICTARMEIILKDSSAATMDHVASCTFETVYAEYLGLTSRAKMSNNASPFTTNIAVGPSTRVFSKKVSKGAWETLCDLRLLVTAAGADRSSSSTAAGCGNSWRCEIALEEIGGVIGTGAGWGGSGSALARWCRDL